MPQVGIIIRTRDRPITLPRALHSVASQHFSDWQVAIVNDGGDRAVLEAAVGQHLGDRSSRATLIHHDTSRGRWAAANAGVAALDCRYLVIHDDDDSWHPTFLERTVAALSAADSSIGGVATRVMEVSEKLVNNKIIVKRRRPLMPELRAISLAEMSRNNYITPISFLYRHEVHDRVGLYDDKLPVLGDWEFYLRMLRYHDVRLIDERLANYHKRNDSLFSRYSNTVVGAVSLHYETDARIRNRLLREDIENGIVGMGTLVTLGRQARHLDDVVATIAQRLASYTPSWRLFTKNST